MNSLERYVARAKPSAEYLPVSGLSPEKEFLFLVGFINLAPEARLEVIGRVKALRQEQPHSSTLTARQMKEQLTKLQKGVTADELVKIYAEGLKEGEKSTAQTILNAIAHHLIEAREIARDQKFGGQA